MPSDPQPNRPEASSRARSRPWHGDLTEWRIFLLLRGVLTAAVLYVLQGSGDAALIAQGTVLVLLGLSNFGLARIPDRLWQRQSFRSALLLFDIFILTGALYWIQAASTDLYLAYFVVLGAVAMSGSQAWGSVITVGIVAAYGGLLYLQEGSALLHSPRLLGRLPFLFLAGVMSALVAAHTRAHRRHSEASRELIRWTSALTATLATAGPARQPDFFEIVNLLHELIPGTLRASLVRVVGDEVQVLVSSDDPQLDRLTLDLSCYPEIEEAFASGEPVVIDELRTHPLTSHGRRLVESLPFSALLICPISVNDPSVGQLALLVAREAGTFTRGQADLCAQIAEVIGVISRQQEMRSTIRRVEAEVKAKASLLENQDQLRQAQKMEAVGQLAGGVAHDFNNLITAIIMNSEILRARLGDDAPQLEHVDEIIGAARQGSSLTSQLLAFSRGHALEPRVVDLNAVVLNVEGMLRRLIGEHIDFVVQLDPAIGHTMIDPTQLEHALVNLAINARDAMPTGGQLAIRTANVEPGTEGPWSHDGDVLSDSYVMLTVSDTGSGMDAETRQHLFEPFFTTKEVGQGTGLGLSTVYGFVTQSGGHIEVESEPERGATFAIYLPRFDEAVKKPPLQATSELPHGLETILLVEDEELVRRPVANALRSCGYEVLDADRPVEAVRVCRDHTGPIHLMVTDIVMPGMTGVELAERIAGMRADIKILFMSGYTEKLADLSPARSAFLAKPFDSINLAQKVREMLDSG